MRATVLDSLDLAAVQLAVSRARYRHVAAEHDPRLVESRRTELQRVATQQAHVPECAIVAQ